MTEGTADVRLVDVSKRFGRVVAMDRLNLGSRPAS